MHSTNTIYGAGRSLKNWVTDAEIPFDILYPKGLSKIDEKKFKSEFGPFIENVFGEWLPFSSCFFYKNGATWKGKLYRVFSQFMYHLFKSHLKQRLNSSNYDLVYLNSLTLYQMIESQGNFVIHVRDIFDGSKELYQDIVNHFKRACGIIFIDYATYKPFEKEKLNYVIYNNPFDMTNVANVNKELWRNRLYLTPDKTVFSVLGVISEPKGVGHIIQAFHDSGVQAYLLVVGNTSGHYAKYCKNLAKDMENVIFTGEIKEIECIYAISDVILRGEPFFCIGRTIFEGLYSGCHILIPGTGEDMKNIPEADKFKERIWFYNPNTKGELKKQLKKLEKTKVMDRGCISNKVEYIENMKKYLALCLGGRNEG